MFELENEITHWKQAVVSNGVVSSEELTELESHLRESIAALREKGLTAQEAFTLGANRLGHPLALQKEYAKNNLSARWKQRVFWMLAGYIGIGMIERIVSVIGTTTGAAMAYGGFGGSASGVAMISLMFIAWSVVFVTAFRKRHWLGSKNDVLPLKWMVAIGATLVLAPAINMLARTVSIMSVGVVWYGEASTYLHFGGFMLNFCIVTLCLVALCKLNDRTAWNLD